MLSERMPAQRREWCHCLAGRGALSLAAVFALAACHPAAATQASATAAPAPSASAAATASPSEDPAVALHRDAIVIDTHNDVTQRLLTDKADLGTRLADGQTDIPRMREGGLDAEFLSVFVPPKLFPGEHAYERAIAEFDAIDAFIASHKGSAVLARTASEVRAAAASGTTAFLIGVEGGHSLGDASDDELLRRLQTFFDRGARYMTLTWSNSNRLGGSSGDDGRTRGLTPFGQRVVARMNELGMMVDISHVSDATFFDAVHASKLPVLASHSSARALFDHPRNMTDDMIRAVAANGGAVCVNFGPEFLDHAYDVALEAAQKSMAPRMGAIMAEQGSDAGAAMAALWNEFRGLGKSVPPVSAIKVIDHIEHIARVAGADHVCIGSDFDGIPVGPVGLDDVSKLPFITRELLRRGFDAADIRKILGENVLRVLDANQRGPAAASRPVP
jgi:membrane dipeptidase